jgi:hypothetical protein
MGYNEGCEVKELVGKTLKDVYRDRENESIFFLTGDGTGYVMYHSQSCCENVTIESIVGDLQDLVGTPILVAEERTHTNLDGVQSGTVPDLIWITAWKAKHEDHYTPILGGETWTFYTFRTIKGSVDIRWCGSSNGYYSESVDFERIASESN